MMKLLSTNAFQRFRNSSRSFQNSSRSFQNNSKNFRIFGSHFSLSSFQQKRFQSNESSLLIREGTPSLIHDWNTYMMTYYRSPSPRHLGGFFNSYFLFYWANNANALLPFITFFGRALSKSPHRITNTVSSSYSMFYENSTFLDPAFPKEGLEILSKFESTTKWIVMDSLFLGLEIAIASETPQFETLISFLTSLSYMRLIKGKNNVLLAPTGKKYFKPSDHFTQIVKKLVDDKTYEEGVSDQIYSAKSVIDSYFASFFATGNPVYIQQLIEFGEVETKSGSTGGAGSEVLNQFKTQLFQYLTDTLPNLAYQNEDIYAILQRFFSTPNTQYSNNFTKYILDKTNSLQSQYGKYFPFMEVSSFKPFSFLDTKYCETKTWLLEDAHKFAVHNIEQAKKNLLATDFIVKEAGTVNWDLVFQTIKKVSDKALIWPPNFTSEEEKKSTIHTLKNLIDLFTLSTEITSTNLSKIEHCQSMAILYNCAYNCDLPQSFFDLHEGMKAGIENIIANEAYKFALDLNYSNPNLHYWYGHFLFSLGTQVLDAMNRLQVASALGSEHADLLLAEAVFHLSDEEFRTKLSEVSSKGANQNNLSKEDFAKNHLKAFLKKYPEHPRAKEFLEKIEKGEKIQPPKIKKFIANDE